MNAVFAPDEQPRSSTVRNSDTTPSTPHRRKPAGVTPTRLDGLRDTKLTVNDVKRVVRQQLALNFDIEDVLKLSPIFAQDRIIHSRVFGHDERRWGSPPRHPNHFLQRDIQAYVSDFAETIVLAWRK